MRNSYRRDKSTREFLAQDKCDRCKTKMIGRTESWFKNETICLACNKEEEDMRTRLISEDKVPIEYEGIGYLPYPSKRKVK